MIRTFLFDLGNVLLYFSHDVMCAQIGALCGHSGAEIRRLVFDSGLQWEFERGQLSEEQFRQRLETIVKHPLDLGELRRAASDIFVLNAPLLPILDALKQRGHRLVLLSNTSITHFEWVRTHYDVLERFDDWIVSFRVGAIKPEPEIYQAALAAIDCPPENCFYTDDIPAYVVAARTFGLDAEVFTGAPDLLAQLAARGVSWPAGPDASAR